LLLSNTKIAIQQRYLGETKLKVVVVLLSRVERDKTLGEIAIPNCSAMVASYYYNNAEEEESSYRAITPRRRSEATATATA
jgi:hypothetical protein